MGIFKKEQNGSARERGFTLTELLVIIATTALLAALWLPALASDEDDSQRAICINNMKQLGAANNMYATDFLDRMAYPNFDGGNTLYVGAGINGWLYSGNVPQSAADALRHIGSEKPGPAIPQHLLSGDHQSSKRGQHVVQICNQHGHLHLSRGRQGP